VIKKMEIIKEEEFKSANDLPLVEREEFKDIGGLTESEFKNLLEDMKNPIKAQKYLAVQIKNYLDQKIAEELKNKKILSDHTRRWVKVFNEILDKIQKAMYGEKSVNLHIHKVTHAQIAMKMREAEEE